MYGNIKVTGVNIVYLTVLILFVVFSIAVGVAGIIAGKDLTSEYFDATLLITQYLLILVPVIVYAFVKKLNIKEVFRFRRLNFIPALIIAAIALPAIYVASMLNSVMIFLLQFIGEIPPNSIPIPGNAAELAQGILLVAVSPAICEEMLHRGLLLRAYEKRGSIKAVFISAIMFGLFHFDITNLFGPIFLGLLIGYYVIRTNSIFAGMLAHFINNALAEVFSYMAGSAAETEKIAISLQDLGYQVIMGLVGLIIVYFLLKLFKKATVRTAILNKPISSIRKDITSIVSHWPVIVTIVLYVLLMVLFIVSITIAKMSGGI